MKYKYEFKNADINKAGLVQCVIDSNLLKLRVGSYFLGHINLNKITPEVMNELGIIKKKIN